jgi:hypothetical protein
MRVFSLVADTPREMLWEQEVAGSNPAAPTQHTLQLVDMRMHEIDFHDEGKSARAVTMWRLRGIVSACAGVAQW